MAGSRAALMRPSQTGTFVLKGQPVVGGTPSAKQIFEAGNVKTAWIPIGMGAGGGALATTGGAGSQILNYLKGMPALIKGMLAGVGGLGALDIATPDIDIFSPLGTGLGGGLGGGSGTGIGTQGGRGTDLAGFRPGSLFHGGLSNGRIPSEWVAYEWDTGTAHFYRLIDGRIATQKKNGVWKVYRAQKHIVVPRNPRIGTLLSADRRTDRLVESLAKRARKYGRKR